MTCEVALGGVVSELSPKLAPSCFLTKELLRLNTTFGTPEVDAGRRLPPPPPPLLSPTAGAGAYLLGSCTRNSTATSSRHRGPAR